MTQDHTSNKAFKDKLSKALVI